MKKLLFYIAVVVIFSGLVYSVISFNKNSQNQAASENNITNSANKNAMNNLEVSSSVQGQAIDFKLIDLSGKEVSLSDFKGKRVFLNFFATWCPPCRGEMPDMQKLYDETKDSDLIILAVNLGEDAKTVRNFIDKNKYSFKVLLDSDSAVASKYGIVSIPTSYFIDRNGNILAKHIGALTSEEMKNYISSLK